MSIHLVFLWLTCAEMPELGTVGNETNLDFGIFAELSSGLLNEIKFQEHYLGG